MSDLPPVKGAPKTAFIQDGYTRHGYIAETEFHPSCRFEYRPATILDRQQFLMEFNRETEIHGPEAGETAAGEWMVKHLNRWDLVDGGGHAVPVTARNMTRLTPKFYDRLLGIMLGSQLSDRDPSTNDRPTSEEDAIKN